MKLAHLGCVAVLLGSLAPVQVRAQEGEYRVKLLQPLSTETSKKGDKITAQVLSPPEFQGDFMEGMIKQSKSGHRVKGKSVLSFYFDTLNHEDQRIPIQSTLRSVVNSKGQPGVDEEGFIVKRKNNLGKIVAVAAIGAVLGGLAGGAQGAAEGAALGGLVGLVVVQVGVQGPRVSFAPGSEFVLAVKKR